MDRGGRQGYIHILNYMQNIYIYIYIYTFQPIYENNGLAQVCWA